MPCFDPRDNEERHELKDKNSKLEAALCAIAAELSRNGILEVVVANASRNGLINIYELINSHELKDRERIAKDLHKRYSKDELELIKKLLEEGI